MKKYVIALLALASVAGGCKKEGALEPTPVKNWLEITDPGANADAVDRKIYDIYKRHGVSVYYTDTIGVEDRGWVDENGKPKLYHEIIDLNYNLAAAAPGTDVVLTWTRLEWWKPEEKSKILPLLELLDQKLIPFAADRGGIPRIVIMTDRIMTGNRPVDSYIYNGTGYTAIQAGYYTDESSATNYIADFIQPLMSDFPEGALDEYYDVARQAFRTYVPDIWNGSWYYYANYFPNYPRAFKMVTWLDLTAERERLKALIDGGDTSAATARQYDDVLARIAAINLTQAQMDEAAAQESAFRAEYESRRPELFGLIELYVNQNNLELLYLPPSDMDLASFMYALLGMTDAEFKAKYAAFPLVTRRFDLLKTAFEDAGIDLDLLRL